MQGQKFVAESESRREPVTFDPSYVRAYLNRAIVWYRKGPERTAMSTRTECLALNSVQLHSIKALTMVGLVVSLIAAPARAQSVLQRSGSAALYLARGKEQLARGHLNEALVDLDTAIKFEPGFAAAYYERARIFAIRGDLANAIADFTTTIEINSRFVMAYDGRGIAYLSEGYSDKAIADFNKAIEIDPRYAPAYINRGSIRQLKGQFYQAIADFDKAISINSRLAQAYNNRGAVRTALG